MSTASYFLNTLFKFIKKKISDVFRKNNPALKTSSGQSSGGGGSKPRPSQGSQGSTRTAPKSPKTNSAASTNPQGSNTRNKPKRPPANSEGNIVHFLMLIFYMI